MQSTAFSLRQFSRAALSTKNKDVFTNDTALEKLVYLGLSQHQKEMDDAIGKLGTNSPTISHYFPRQIQAI
jgi:hypothetical protein